MVVESDPIDAPSDMKTIHLQRIETLENSQTDNDNEAQSNVEKSTNDEDLKVVDMKLVDKVRELIETKILDEIRMEQYSEQHYQELMDPKSPFTCWRYLSQCDLDIDDTLKLVKSALIWRKLNGFDESMNEKFPKEFWFHSVMTFCGTDKSGNDVLYAIGRHYRKFDSKYRHIGKAFCTNLLFDWDRKHRHDLKQGTFVFDATNTGYQNMDLDFMAWLVETRNYIPSRIANIYVVGMPLIIRPLVRLVISWLPEKISRVVQCGGFDQLVLANIESNSIPQEVGGSCPESSYRLAPPEAPWAVDWPLFSDEDMLKYLQKSFWFHVTDERKQRLQAMQEEHENKATQKR